MTTTQAQAVLLSTAHGMGQTARAANGERVVPLVLLDRAKVLGCYRRTVRAFEDGWSETDNRAIVAQGRADWDGR